MGHSEKTVEEARAYLGNMCKDMMSNREMIFASLMQDMAKSASYKEGLQRVASTVEEGSDANLRKQLKNVLITSSHLLEMNQRILALLVVYLVGGSATKDAGSAAIRFGVDGKEILQQMLRNKMRDN